MEPGTRQLREVLADITFQSPRVPFVSSVSGVPETNPGAIRGLLGAQLCSPVRWTDVMRWLGPRPCVEAGPGVTLQGLAKRMDGGPVVAAAGTLEAADQLVREAGG
jgi:[acyl-carrier-protein] S-malonyltransferase